MNFLKSSIFKYLLATFLVWAALFYSSIESTVAIWYRSETFAHCFIILPICIYLIKLKWSKLHDADLKPSLLALLFIAGTLVMWLFGSMAQVLIIEQYATFAMLPLMIWCLMGTQVARILLFASLFWLFSVPAGEFLIPQLQELTADITVFAIELTGIPVYREGLYIAIPGGLFEVAVACSGIRYLIASFTLGTLFAYLNYTSIKKRVIFILFAIALPLLANGMRAYGIVMIAHLSDMKYATGVDHLVYGWLFFGLVIFIMFTVGARWADPIPKAGVVTNPTGPKMDWSSMLKPGVGLLVLLIASLGYKHAFENLMSSVSPDISSVFSSEKPVLDQSWLPIFNNPTEIVTGQQDGIDYYYAYYNGNIQGKELINGSNKLYNIERWSIVSDDANERFRTLEIIDNHGRSRLLTYAYVTPWHVTHKSMEIKLAQALQALVGQPQNGFILVMSKPLKDRKIDKQILEQKASEFFNAQPQAMLADD